MHSTSFHIAKLFDCNWLCRYPRPLKVFYDAGGEFSGMEFQELLISYGIKKKPITVKNPQANGIIENVHLTMADMLRTEQPFIQDERDTWIDEVNLMLQGIAFAMRCTIGATIKHSPSQIVFNQDMITRIKTRTDWMYISRARDKEKVKSNNLENKSRINYEYKKDDEVLIVKSADERRRQKKIGDPIKEGPYKISRVYNNGTVDIQRGVVTENMSIRRLEPYYSNNTTVEDK